MAKRGSPVAARGGDSNLDAGPRSVLQALKRLGPSDVASLATALKVSRPAVRHHLYALAKENLVTSTEEARPIGRPAKIWSLTPNANDFFVDRHGDLTLAFVQSAEELLGEQGLIRIVEHCTRQQVDAYQEKIPKKAPLSRRLKALVRIRNDEGFMADLKSKRDGTFLLIENHCPIAKLAGACRHFCDAELHLFQHLLRDQAEVTRSEHMAAEGQRCTYTIEPKTRKR